MHSILAIDPATKTGICFDGKLASWQLDVVHKGTNKGLRHRAFFELLMQTVSGRDVNLIVYEKASSGAGAQRNTALFHAELEGVILLVAGLKRIETLAVYPTQLKKFATGSGAAKKPQMIAAANLFGAQVGNDSDLADAFHLYQYGAAFLKGNIVCPPKKPSSTKRGLLNSKRSKSVSKPSSDSTTKSSKQLSMLPIDGKP